MINYRKRGLIQQKPQIWKVPKIPLCMKSWKKKQKKGYKGLTGLVREKPCKNLVENDKKSSVEPCQVGKREESLKKCFEWVKTLFKKKLDSRCSIDRKTGSINQTRQRFTEIFQKDFD